MTQPCERQLICTYTEVIGLGQQRINSQDQCPYRITTIVACCSIDDCRCTIEYMTQPCEQQLLCTYTEVIGLDQQRINSQDQCPYRITLMIPRPTRSNFFPYTKLFRYPCERQLICTYTEVIGLGQQRINSQDQCPDRITTIVACCSIDDCRCAIEYMTQPCERQLICTYTQALALGQHRIIIQDQCPHRI